MVQSSEVQGSAQPPVKKTAGQIENETDVSYDLHGIRLRAQGVCMRFNLILFVLVLVLVLEIRILLWTRDEDEVRILQPRVEFHENNIGHHEVS